MTKNLIMLTALSLMGSKAFADFESVSPDGKIRVTAVTYDNNEAQVFVSAVKTGISLGDDSFISPDHQHGRVILNYQWTADSRFFVFTTQSSGGHDVGEYGGFFFSRDSQSFRDMEVMDHNTVIGGIVSATFTLGTSGAPDNYFNTFTTMIQKPGQDSDSATTQSLSIEGLDNARVPLN